jgi:hypothetical protein
MGFVRNKTALINFVRLENIEIILSLFFNGLKVAP